MGVVKNLKFSYRDRTGDAIPSLLTSPLILECDDTLVVLFADSHRNLVLL